MSLKRYPVDRHMVALFRRVFMRDNDSRAALTILVRDMGHFSPESEDPLERGQQEYAKRLLQMCGIFYAKNARSYIDSMLDNVPEMWNTSTEQALTTKEVQGRG